MRHLDWKDPVDFWRKKTAADWWEDMLYMAKYISPNLPEDLYEEIQSLTYAKLQSVKGVGFPACVKGYPNCAPKKVLNYLNTTVRSVISQLMKERALKEAFHTKYLKLKEELLAYNIDEPWIDELLLKLSPLEQELLKDCLIDPHTWHINPDYSTAQKRLFKERVAGLLLQYVDNPAAIVKYMSI